MTPDPNSQPEPMGQRRDNTHAPFFDVLIGVVSGFLLLCGWIVLGSVLTYIPLINILALIFLPFGYYVTLVIVIRKCFQVQWPRVVIGVVSFLGLWLMVSLWQRFEATERLADLASERTSVNWESLPPAVMLGKMNTVDPCPRECAHAVKKGLAVFKTNERGVQRLSLGSGDVCLQPENVEAAEWFQAKIPEGQCLVVVPTSNEKINAVKFMRQSPLALDGSWGKGFPSYQGRYHPWEIQVYERGTVRPIGQDGYGKVQYPFFLPIVYLGLPATSSFYEAFLGVQVLSATTKQGSFLSLSQYIETLANAVGTMPVASS